MVSDIHLAITIQIPEFTTSAYYFRCNGFEHAGVLRCSFSVSSIFS